MARGTSKGTANLPEDVTSLVGRRAEAAELRRLLTRSRMVTLTGPGGVGKTRLALHVARASRAAFRDNVWLLALDEVTQPDLLPSIVMSTLGKPGPAGTGIVEVTAYLRDRELLLIMDNCEHLADDCAKLASELLRSCPSVRVLATSREPLRIDGEAVFRVPPLSLPEPGTAFSVGAGAFEAVALFLERASALNTGFALREDQEQAVIALCQSLDGLPLAIELAAAGSRSVPIEDLSAWAGDPLMAPAFGKRTSPLRHQTLHATMEYSHQLCSEDARILWARMSVFRGGAELDAVAEVCAGELLPAKRVPAVLTELIDKSIATFDGRRYRLLETIRQFGAEHLRSLGEQHATQQSHRDHFAELADEVSDGWFGPDQPALLTRVLADQANVRAALQFCLGQEGEIVVGLRMASALWPAWIGCGLPGEGKHWLDRLLAASAGADVERATALWVAGYLTTAVGEFRAGLALLEQSLQLATMLGHRPSIAHATQRRGLNQLLQERSETAIRDLEEAVHLERELGDDNPHLAEALLYLGMAECYRDSFEAAAGILEEARSLCARKGEQLFLSWTLLGLGLVALMKERVPEAVALIKDGLIRKRALDDRVGLPYAVEMLAWAALSRRDAERCAVLLAGGEAMSRHLGPHLAGNHRMLRWHEEYVQQAQAALGSRAYEAAAERGRQLTHDQLIDLALEKAAPSPKASGEAADLPLTPREREICGLVATGMTNKEIAAKLVISPRTADTHVEHILTKLNFTSRTQVVALFAAHPEHSS